MNNLEKYAAKKKLIEMLKTANIAGGLDTLSGMAAKAKKGLTAIKDKAKHTFRTGPTKKSKELGKDLSDRRFGLWNARDEVRAYRNATRERLGPLKDRLFRRTNELPEQTARFLSTLPRPKVSKRGLRLTNPKAPMRSIDAVGETGRRSYVDKSDLARWQKMITPKRPRPRKNAKEIEKIRGPLSDPDADLWAARSAKFRKLQVNRLRSDSAKNIAKGLVLPGAMAGTATGSGLAFNKYVQEPHTKAVARLEERRRTNQLKNLRKSQAKSVEKRKRLQEKLKSQSLELPLGPETAPKAVPKSTLLDKKNYQYKI
jgi:hypothetical protein